MSAWKVLGALVSLNGIDRYLYCPYRVLNVVFHLSSLSTRTWQYASGRSSLLNYIIPQRRSCILLFLGKGYRFLIVMAFSLRQSIQSRFFPPGLGINRIGDAIGPLSSTIIPFFRFLSRYTLSSISSSCVREYKGLKVGSFPGISFILWSYSLCFGSALASSGSSKRSLKSQYSLGSKGVSTDARVLP